MKLVATHCDTLLKLHENDCMDFHTNEALHVDIVNMQKADTLLACFALFNIKDEDGYRYERFDKFFKFYMRVIEKHSYYLKPIDKFSDIERIYASGKTPIMITIEDMGPFMKGLDQIQEMYDMGVRMASFTWNHETTFGFPCSRDESINSKGLTKKGFEAAEIMNELGIIIDVSHLSDGGISDLLSHSKKPIIASHSNSRTITGHPRNCTDEQIKKISEKGGFLGLNFGDLFLSDDYIASVENMVKHIDYMVKVGGIECMAIGTDFDGVGDKTLEIKSIGDMDKLVAALNKAGYSDDNIEKIFYINAMRTFNEIIK